LVYVPQMNEESSPPLTPRSRARSHSTKTSQEKEAKKLHRKTLEINTSAIINFNDELRDSGEELTVYTPRGSERKEKREKKEKKERKEEDREDKKEKKE